MSQHYPSQKPAVAGSSAGGLGSGGGGSGGGGLLPFYHVPQQSRREKLRFPSCSDVVDPSLLMAMAPPSSNPNPSLHPHLDVELHYQHLFPSPSQQQQQQQQQRHGPLSLARGPSEPFTGYAAVLKASRFLRPAQQLLEEICDVGLSLQPCADASLALGEPHPLAPSASDAHGRTKTRLISMLDEVCRRYKQYYQQILDVVASFESVAGLKNAAPYTSLALNSMTRHFRSLKNAISDQLHFTERAPGKGCPSKDELPGFGILNGGLCYPGTSARPPGAILQPNVWRPQRGLPERAVAVLKAWLFEHFLHPYPSDADKHMLARQTGLSRNQVSNWFINARVRLWKPLVEEIHALEVRQGRKTAPDQADPNNRSNAAAQANAPSTSTNQQSTENPPSLNNHPPKRHRNDLAEMSNHMEEQIGFPFDEFSIGRVAGSAPMPNSSTNGGVSLTLGLHQNNGVCLTETLPFNVARRFGLEDAATPFSIGGFELQDRHFSKDIDGQLLRDFVG